MSRRRAGGRKESSGNPAELLRRPYQSHLACAAIHFSIGRRAEGFQRGVFGPRSLGSGYHIYPSGAGRRQARSPHFVQRCRRRGVKILRNRSPKVRLCERVIGLSQRRQRGTVSAIGGLAADDRRHETAGITANVEHRRRLGLGGHGRLVAPALRAGRRFGGRSSRRHIQMSLQCMCQLNFCDNTIDYSRCTQKPMSTWSLSRQGGNVPDHDKRNSSAPSSRHAQASSVWRAPASST